MGKFYLEEKKNAELQRDLDRLKSHLEEAENECKEK
jgi:hypothetical protein